MIGIFIKGRRDGIVFNPGKTAKRCRRIRQAERQHFTFSNESHLEVKL
jgi:hypothetical protein